LQRFEEALQGFEKLLALDDTLAEPWLRHAQTLHALGRLTQAVPSYQRAVALQPEQPQAWGNLGGILRELNRREEAAHAFRQALQHGGDDEFLRYSLASVIDSPAAGVASGTPPITPAVAPSAYVQSLFDAYADDFDAHLLGVLRYRTPQVLLAPLLAMRQNDSGAPARFTRFESVLDLGCGTGLCGPLIKPRCDRLIGVDLSQGMLDKAALLGVYDTLAQGEIVEHLRHTTAQTPGCHNLVLAADVFVYIGDLAPVFEATWQVLKPGGLFCFSVELARSETLDFELLPSLRYAHSERYVRQLAAEQGFELVHLARAPVREDQQRAIEGLLIHLRRSS
jgi:predicted TPR repeat methyltransferase